MYISIERFGPNATTNWRGETHDQLYHACFAVCALSIKVSVLAHSFPVADNAYQISAREKREETTGNGSWAKEGEWYVRQHVVGIYSMICLVSANGKRLVS